MSLSKSRCFVIVGVFCTAVSMVNAQTAGAGTQSSSPTGATTGAEQKPASTNSAESNPGEQKSEAAAPRSSEESIPTTTVFPDKKTQQNYLAPELVPPPLPKEKIALVGGVVRNIDQVRNRMQLQIFGAGKMNVIFDERTKFDRNGENATQMAVKPGDRVYLDTQLANGKIFARNVHIRTAAGIASASGQVISYNAKSGDVYMRDQISKRPVNFRITQTTMIKSRDGEGMTPAVALQPNALIAVRLGTAPGNHAVANEVNVIASPGQQFTFYGTLSHLDLRSGMLAVDNKSDNRPYEIQFVPNQIGVTDDLRVGAEVSVVATFNGTNYTARSVTVNRSAQAAPPDAKP